MNFDVIICLQRLYRKIRIDMVSKEVEKRKCKRIRVRLTVRNQTKHSYTDINQSGIEISYREYHQK